MNCIKCHKRPSITQWKGAPVCETCLGGCQRLQEYERQIGRSIILASVLTILLLLMAFTVVLLSVAFVLGGQ